MRASASRRLASGAMAARAGGQARHHHVGDRGEPQAAQGQSLAAEEIAHEGVAVGRREVDGRPGGDDGPVAQDDDLRRELERLDGIVRDEEDRLAGLAVDAHELLAQARGA